MTTNAGAGERVLMDVAEFQRSGFLQEANRLFFHPHGLALEVARANEPVAVVAVTSDMLRRLRAACEGDRELSEALDGAVVYAEGEMWLSGVRDCRDDPEGVVFGGSTPERAGKAVRVLAERERHSEARRALFGAESDIETMVPVFEL